MEDNLKELLKSVIEDLSDQELGKYVRPVLEKILTIKSRGTYKMHNGNNG